MPPPLEFSHIGFFVTDLDKTQDFYTRVLGFPITDEGLLGTQRLTFLSRNPKEHHQVVLVEGRPRTLPFNVINQISWMKGGGFGLGVSHGHDLFHDLIADVDGDTHVIRFLDKVMIP